MKCGSNEIIVPVGYNLPRGNIHCFINSPVPGQTAFVNLAVHLITKMETLICVPVKVPVKIGPGNYCLCLIVGKMKPKACLSLNNTGKIVLFADCIKDLDTAEINTQIEAAIIITSFH